VSPADGNRRELERRAEALERELFAVRDQLRRLGSDVLPGTFLEAELPGLGFLVPVAAVREVAWLVALEPVAGAPPWVAGTFSYRGELCVAVDLARRLGGEREPPLDAKLLVLAATRPVAVIVDRVIGLAENPQLLPTAEEVAAPFTAVCARGTELLPLLDPEALVEPETPAAP
jgi:chemotaxis signal transduction protein